MNIRGASIRSQSRPSTTRSAGTWSSASARRRGDPRPHIPVNGGNGDDILNGGAGAEHFIGGNGKDAVDGNGGSDTADLGSGTDSFTWDPGEPRSYPVRECLLCILNEEWEHRLYAERDLGALDTRSA